jgi:hypothetical protein
MSDPQKNWPVNHPPDYNEKLDLFAGAESGYSGF